ncbi:MAG: hypothetical protein U0X73_14595 [Thermoanaerobaculia bacterium]
MRPMTALRAALLLLLGSSSLAIGQNLLTNSDFDAGLGLSSWIDHTGTWVLGSDATGCALSDAADGTSEMAASMQYLAIYSQECIDVDPVATPALYLGGLYKSAGAGYARLYLQYFAAAGCVGPTGWSDWVYGGDSPAWAPLLGAVAIPAGVAAVRVWGDFVPLTASAPQFTGAYDRLYLGATPLLFADDFEFGGGSACRWSSVAGGV